MQDMSPIIKHAYNTFATASLQGIPESVFIFSRKPLHDSKWIRYDADLFGRGDKRRQDTSE